MTGISGGQPTLFDVGHLSDMSDTPSQKSLNPNLREGEPKNSSTCTSRYTNYFSYSYTRASTPESAVDMSDMSDMSDTCPPQPVTTPTLDHYIRPESRGTLTWPAYLAHCQQCETRHEYTDHDEREEWVTHHRRTTGHNTLTGYGPRRNT